jgi:dihydrofolate reductase
MMMDRLIDELIVSIVPIILGQGIKLFACRIPESDLEFVEAKTFETGLVQLRYRIIK